MCHPMLLYDEYYPSYPSSNAYELFTYCSCEAITDVTIPIIATAIQLSYYFATNQFATDN